MDTIIAIPLDIFQQGTGDGNQGMSGDGGVSTLLIQLGGVLKVLPGSRGVCGPRSVRHTGQVQGEVLSENVIWQMLRPYGVAAGFHGISPHDCRRTAAKLWHAAGGELE